MPISYTKRGWTNNSPPAINAANLGAMDDALKLTADTVDAATATPAANAIPKADGSGKLDAWVSDASESTAGKVQLATNGESASSKAVQASDSRLSDARTPTAHAASHKHSGSDEIATATPAANAIPKADGSGKLDSWISDATTSANGKVQLATAAELEAGTDAAKALTPAVVRPATIKRSKMPDGATAVYSQDAWATTDGWGNNNSTMTASNGVLRTTWNGSGGYYGPSKPLSIPSGSAIAVRIRFSHPNLRWYFSLANPVNYVIGDSYLPSHTDWRTYVVFTGAAGIELKIYRATPLQSGEWMEIDWVWIGSYSYLDGSLTEDAVNEANYIASLPSETGAYATDSITIGSSNMTSGDYVLIQARKYIYTTNTPTNEGEVLIGATAQESAQNLADAINRDSPGTKDGVKYKASLAHPLVTAATNDITVNLTATIIGEYGNGLRLERSGSNLTIGTMLFSGGYSGLSKKLATLTAPIIAGNGTRPAAALIELTDTTKIGYEHAIDVAAGGTVTMPSGGTWIWVVYGYGATGTCTGYTAQKKGTLAGGGTLTVNSANATVWYRRYA